MSEFAPDPDFSILRRGIDAAATQIGRELGDDEMGFRGTGRDLGDSTNGDGAIRGVENIIANSQKLGKTAMRSYAASADLVQLRQLADQWQSSAPKDHEIDDADAAKASALQAMAAADRFGTPIEQAETTAAATAATKYAQSLRAMRIAADDAFNSGASALMAKVEQRGGPDVKSSGPSYGRTPPTNALNSLKPPAAAPRTPGAGTPAAPRTPAAPGAGTPAAPRTQLSKADMPTMPQVPQGQAQPQSQQQPHPQAAAAGGAPTGTPTAKATDKKRDGTDSAPTGLAAAVGATGAGASPVPSAATTPRPTNPGYSRDGMVTGTNVSGRPSPGVSLSAGMPATAPATAAGTAAAPGTGIGQPMMPMGGGVGNGKGAGAAKDAPRIVQAQEPYDASIVRGGTILRHPDDARQAG